MSDEINELKAGHPAAVKAGGMRIVQNKTPQTERPAKDQEDCTGLTSPPPTPDPKVISGAVVNGHSDFTAEAAKVAHKEKAPYSISQQPMNNINQPRRMN